MTTLELARLVGRMRQKQNEYGRIRNPTVLAECRDLERRVDAAVRAVVSPPSPTLFE